MDDDKVILNRVTGYEDEEKEKPMWDLSDDYLKYQKNKKNEKLEPAQWNIRMLVCKGARNCTIPDEDEI